MSTRATLLGAHDGLREPLVVDGGADGAVRDGTGTARLVARDRGRATLRMTHPDRPGTEHQLLVASASDVLPRTGRLLEVVVDGWRFEVEVEPEARAALREKARRDRGDSGHSGPAEVRAIIPGVVVSVAVATGDEVEAGQQLLVVEAMKMQNELRAPRPGKVERVLVGERSTIEVGDVLVVIE